MFIGLYLKPENSTKQTCSPWMPLVWIHDEYPLSSGLKKTWSLQAAWVIPEYSSLSEVLWRLTLLEHFNTVSCAALKSLNNVLVLALPKITNLSLNCPVSLVISSIRCSGMIQICTAHLAPDSSVPRGFKIMFPVSLIIFERLTSYVTQRWNHLLHDQLCFLSESTFPFPFIRMSSASLRLEQR